MCYKSFILCIYCIREIYFLTTIIPTAKCISILWCLWLFTNYSSIIFINISNCTSWSSKFNSIFIDCPWSCNYCSCGWHWIRNLFIPMNCISSLCPRWFSNIWCRRIIISCIYYISISTISISKSDFIAIDSPFSIDSHTSSWHSFRNFYIPTCKSVSSFNRIIYMWNNCIIILRNISDWSSSICIEMDCILIYFPLSCDSHIFSWHLSWNCFIPTVKSVSSFSWICWLSDISAIFSRNYIISFSIILNKCNCVSISSIVNLYYSHIIVYITIDFFLITSNIST